MQEPHLLMHDVFGSIKLQAARFCFAKPPTVVCYEQRVADGMLADIHEAPLVSADVRGVVSGLIAYCCSHCMWVFLCMVLVL